MNRRRGILSQLVQADLRRLPFRSSTFDAVVSTYAVIHVPRQEHIGVLREFRRVLVDDGLLLATMGEDPWEGIETLHGAEMYWSHFGRDVNAALIREAGFRIVSLATDESGGERHAVFLAASAGTQ